MNIIICSTHSRCVSRRSIVFGFVFFAAAALIFLMVPQQTPTAQGLRAQAEIFTEFDSWSQRFAGGQTANVSEGTDLAAERKPELAKLIETDPETALKYSVSRDVFDRLPESVTTYLEEPVSFYGDLMVYVVDEADRSTGKFTNSRIERQIVRDGKTYKAVVYGRREQMTSKENIPLYGIILDDVMVIDDEPVQKLETHDGRVAANVGGETKYFANQSEFDKFLADQIRSEMHIGPAAVSADSPASPWTEGVKTLLFIRVDFADVPGDPLDDIGYPLTLPVAQSLVNAEIGPFYAANSYGKTSLVGTVTPLVRLPQTRAAYIQSGNWSGMLADARNGARALGLDTNSFNLDLVAFGYTTQVGWLGIGGVGSKGVIINGNFTLGTIAHELGHSYGLWHANAWQPTDGTPNGAGNHIEYGDSFDTMGLGASWGPGAHFNTLYKRRLDWLTDADIRNVTTTGTYRIFAHDLATSGTRALKITKNASKNYWVEFRQLFPSQGSRNGATVRWDNSGGSQTQLLDITPATPNENLDATLLIGQSLVDSASGITITILGKGGTSPESLDVRVQIGTTATPGDATPFDFDGDGKSDISIFRPSDRNWFLLRSTDGFTGYQWGLAGDKIAPADFDGDGKTDVAVWRPSNGRWYVIYSDDFTIAESGWGLNGDVPVPGDFDGDGKADLAVFRPSENKWYVRNSGGTFSTTQFGLAGDKPVVGDFDGDGRNDLVVYRPSNNNWYLSRTTAGFTGLQWGLPGDLIAPADYDGDGSTDVAVWRPSEGRWYWIASGDLSLNSRGWGLNGDIPVPADYDGDGKADQAVFRPSESKWYFFNSSSGISEVPFGLAGDRPTQTAFIQ